VSVLIAVHNRRAYLRECVLSALRAMGPQDEVLLLDDGSTDRPDEVVADLPVRHLSHGQRRRVAEAQPQQTRLGSPEQSGREPPEQWPFT